MLWIALVLNALMLVVELGASLSASSVALLADSIDFFGDTGKNKEEAGISTPKKGTRHAFH